MGDDVCELARGRLRRHVTQRIDGLRARLARYREGDRLGNGDAEAVLGELLRLRALAPLAGLPAGAGELLEGGALEAGALAHSLLRFEVLLGGHGVTPAGDEAGNAEALDRCWREARFRRARGRLQELCAGALARLARELAEPRLPARERLDAAFRQCSAPLDLMGMEAESLALLRCQVALYRDVRSGTPGEADGSGRSGEPGGSDGSDVSGESGESGEPGESGRPRAQSAAARVAFRLAATVRGNAQRSVSGHPANVPEGKQDRLPDDAELSALARAEFRDLARLLRPAGREALRVDSPMLLAVYRLRLHCRSLGLARFGAAFGSAQGLLLAHWNAQVPLDPCALAGLRELAGLFLRFARGEDAGERALHLCELALLRLQRRPGGGEALDIPARRPGAGARPSLPMLMPRHLALLPCARPQWFEDAGALAERVPALRRELAFLERGAARLRVFRIETLAAALLEVYVELTESAAHDGAREGSADSEGRRPEPPAGLLRSAHQRLRAMLNQAAAWQEVSPAPDTAASLLAWVERRRAAQALEDGPPSPRALRAQVHRFAALLCEVLDRRVHLCFTCAPVRLDEPAMAAALRGARALLRLVLGSPEESPWRRRAAGRTAALNLGLRLDSCGKGLVLSLEADQGAPPPDAERIVRRQAGGARLSIETSGGSCRYRLLPRGAGRSPRVPAGLALLTGAE